MSAAKIIFDPAMGLSGTALPPGLLAIAVAFASFVIIVLTLGGVAIEIRARRREIDRTHGIANAAFEGLLVCDGNSIVTVNNNFSALIGCSAATVVGTKLEQYFAAKDIHLTFFDHPNHARSNRWYENSGRTHPEAHRFLWQAASRSSGSRSSCTQGGGKSYPLSGPL